MKQVDLLTLKNNQLEELVNLTKAASQQADPAIENFKTKADTLLRMNGQLKDQLSIKTRQCDDAESKTRKLERDVSR